MVENTCFNDLADPLSLYKPARRSTR